MENISIKYKIDYDRLKDSYFSVYGVSDDDYLKELYDSTAENMKNFEAVFENDKLTVINTDKHETDRFIYADLYKVEKSEDSYLFFINKIDFYFFKFSEFSDEELKKLDSVLRIYYEKNIDKPLAVLENYELNEKRVLEGFKNIYKHLNIGLILFFIFLGILNKSYLDKNFIVLLIFEFLIFSVVIRVLFRFSAKSIVKSTYKKFMRGKIIFDENSMKITGKEKMAGIKVYYNEFYKIKKTKKGYMFFLQRNMFYFLYNYEFQKEELTRLEAVLAKYMKK